MLPPGSTLPPASTLSTSVPSSLCKTGAAPAPPHPPWPALAGRAAGWRQFPPIHTHHSRPVFGVPATCHAPRSVCCLPAGVCEDSRGAQDVGGRGEQNQLVCLPLGRAAPPWGSLLLGMPRRGQPHCHPLCLPRGVLLGARRSCLGAVPPSGDIPGGPRGEARCS